MGKEKPTSEEQPLRALVLDDDPTVRELLYKTLSGEEFEVETVENGRSGLYKLLCTDFDVLLVDIRMSEMDGSTFLQEALNIWPWLGVVVITGYPDDPRTSYARDIGATIFEKPVSPKKVVSAAREAAQNKRGTLEEPAVLSYSQAHQQVKILDSLTHSVLKSQTLVDGLRELANGVGEALSCDIACILALSESTPSIITRLHNPMSKDAVENFQQELIGHYESLTGETIDRDALRTSVEGEGIVENEENVVQKNFMIPLVTDSQIAAILAFGTSSEKPYEEQEMVFMYRAANHLTTVFTVLSQMRDLAIHDSITGLYNRRFIEESLLNALRGAQRYERQVSIIIIDLDDFKFINDTYGHYAGDKVLQEVADLLTSLTREADIVGRYGGDEFTILIADGDQASAVQLAERITDAARNRTFCQDVHPLSLRLSAGVADADEGVLSAENPAESLLSNADQALYIAKWRGRDGVHAWENSQHLQKEPAASTLKSPAEVQQAAMPQLSYRLMIIDDDPSIRELLERFFTKKNFTVDLRSSAEDAAEELTEKLSFYDMVLIDINMPGMSGTELLQQLKGQDDTVLKLIVTGQATVDHALQSLRHGAYDFIEKPINLKQLSSVVDRGLEYRKLLLENQQYRYHLEDMVRKQSAELTRSFNELEKSHEFTLEALVRMLDVREHNYGEHSIRIRETSKVLGNEMNLSDEDMNILAHGALLHDIGKIGIPDHVLLKPAPLTEEEWDIMKQHPRIGYEVLSSSSWLTNAAEIVYSHQEWYNGNGYPRGLKGEEICLGARIFTVADAYDAMRANRPYRNALSIEETVEEIKRNRGEQFDPDVVDAFCQCQPQMEETIQDDHPNQKNAKNGTLIGSND